MKLKILTANIAMGLKHMDNPMVNIWGHLVIHGWSIILLFLSPSLAKKLHAHPAPRRVRYLKKYSSLDKIISLVSKESPDILMLNEVMIQFHQSQLENALRSLGYTSIAWGLAVKYPDATYSSMVASKTPGQVVTINIPGGTYAGGGCNLGILRLSESNITAMATHMSMQHKFPNLYETQIAAMAKFASEEQSSGREVIIGGDWNASATLVQKYLSFSKLMLRNAEGDLPTCPTFLPKLQPLDHIFVPSGWKILNTETIPFGSDHLAVSVTVLLLSLFDPLEPRRL